MPILRSLRLKPIEWRPRRYRKTGPDRRLAESLRDDAGQPVALAEKKTQTVGREFFRVAFTRLQRFFHPLGDEGLVDVPLEPAGQKTDKDLGGGTGDPAPNRQPL